MYEDKSLSQLYRERNRLMDEVDRIETGDIVCIARIYIKTLTWLHLVDIEITRRERESVRHVYDR